MGGTLRLESGWVGGWRWWSVTREERTSKAKSCIQDCDDPSSLSSAPAGGSRGGGFFPLLSQVSPGQRKDRFASRFSQLSLRLRRHRLLLILTPSWGSSTSSSPPPSPPPATRAPTTTSKSNGERKEREGGETVQAPSLFSPLTPEKTVKAF